MGVSTDAILVYGIDLGEEHDFENWDDPLEKLDRLATAEGLTIVMHCADEFPMFIVSDGRESSANRGYPCNIPNGSLTPASHYTIAKIRTFAERFGVTEEPAWLLCSYWG